MSLAKEDAMLCGLAAGCDSSVATSMFLNNVVLFLPPVLPPWKAATDGASATGYTPLGGRGSLASAGWPRRTPFPEYRIGYHEVNSISYRDGQDRDSRGMHCSLVGYPILDRV
jgi:hypothetical protein